MVHLGTPGAIRVSCGIAGLGLGLGLGLGMESVLGTMSSTVSNSRFCERYMTAVMEDIERTEEGLLVHMGRYEETPIQHSRLTRHLS